jgi:hypothetical protein
MAHSFEEKVVRPDFDDAAMQDSRGSDASLTTLSRSSPGSIDTLTLPRSHDLKIIPIPRRMQYDPADPPKLTLFLNIVFAVTTTICGSLWFSDLWYTC